MGDWLKPAKKKRPSGLSNIPENARVEARLFFTLIGHGAWQLAEALWSKSNEMYPTLQEEKGRFSFFGKSGNTLSLPRSGKRKTPTPSFLRSGQDAPFVAKVLLDETSEVGVGEISEHLEPKPKKDRRSWASRRTMSSLGGISLGGQSSFSAKTRKSAMSSASSGSCGSRRRMADADCSVDVKRWNFEGDQVMEQGEGHGVSLSDMVDKAKGALDMLGWTSDDVLDKLRDPLTTKLQEKINEKIHEKFQGTKDANEDDA